VTTNQTGEGTATAVEIKEKTDELQMASLNLFDKMHKARSEEQNTPPAGNAGEAPKEESSEGEKKQ